MGCEPLLNGCLARKKSARLKNGLRDLGGCLILFAWGDGKRVAAEWGRAYNFASSSGSLLLFEAVVEGSLRMM